MRRKKRTGVSKAQVLAQGVGDSKRFIAAGDRDPFEGVRGLHMGGLPVEEVVSATNAHLVTYQHTDEGIAERNAGKQDATVRVRAVAGDRAAVTAEDRDQKLAERRDFKQAGMEPWEAPDPMKELVERYVGPGMRGRFLSPLQNRKHGTRGFEIVNDENGNPVKLGELVLAQMPEEKAEARNRVYREKDRARLREVDQRNQKHVRVDSAEFLRPIVHDVADSQGDDRLHSD